MFRLLLVCALLVATFAFNAKHMRVNSKWQMNSIEKNAAKVFGAALIAGSMISMPVLAKEGTPAKLSFFGSGDMSSPFAAGENREDPLYSPYSPYGNGEKAVYNARKGTAEEVKFWQKKFDECSKRTERIPAYVNKKTWSEITTELTRSLYNYRESMLRLADASSNPEAAKAAAKAYFSDLNDIFEFAEKKKGDVVLASYDKSLKDLETFKAFLK